VGSGIRSSAATSAVSRDANARKVYFVPWMWWADESGIVLAGFRGDLGLKQNLSRDLNYDEMGLEVIIWNDQRQTSLRWIGVKQISPRNSLQARIFNFEVQNCVLRLPRVERSFRVPDFGSYNVSSRHDQFTI
jgi:hypothetical protein